MEAYWTYLDAWYTHTDCKKSDVATGLFKIKENSNSVPAKMNRMAGWSDDDPFMMDDMFPLWTTSQAPTTDGFPYFDSGKTPVKGGWTKFNLPEPENPLPMNEEGEFVHEEQRHYNTTTTTDCSQVLPPDRDCLKFDKRYGTDECN